jgi:glycerol-3-phosphate dehydrogenase (NAD(P)+)
MQELLSSGKNALVDLQNKAQLTTSLREALAHSRYLVVSVASQGLRELLGEISALPLENKVIVLCMKGLETAPASG